MYCRVLPFTVVDLVPLPVPTALPQPDEREATAPCKLAAMRIRARFPQESMLTYKLASR